MFCEECGKQIAEGNKFCDQCGWKVPENKAQYPFTSFRSALEQSAVHHEKAAVQERRQPP